MAKVTETFHGRITQHFKSALHTAYNENGIEAAVASLKENGFSQLQSVYILISELNMSFNEANEFIYTLNPGSQQDTIM